MLKMMKTRIIFTLQKLPAMRKISLFIFLVMTTSVIFAQNTLKFKIVGAKDTTIFLANYYGNKLYYSDTAKCNANGEVTFSTKKKFDPGMYAVVLTGKFFEVVVNNENIYMESDRKDLPGKVVVKQSAENKVFYEYVNFINSKRAEADPLRDKLKSLDKKDAEYKKITDQLTQIDQDVKAKQKDIIKSNPKLYIAKVLNMSIDPEIPEAPKGADGKVLDSLFAYKWLKEHYWDNIDFSDERLVRAPFFHNRVESFFKNMVLQSPDSCFKEAQRLIGKIQATYSPDKNGKAVHDTIRKHEMFKYTVHLLTYTFEQSKVMCMDGAFVQMVFNYHKPGKVWWIKKKDLKKYTDRADELAPVLCQALAHPLSLPDSTMNKWLKLYDVKADYTVLVFWEPTCGHCKKEMPVLAEKHKKLKEKGISVEVYAVSNDHDKDWMKFIKDNKMEDFVNVALPQIYFDKQEMAREVIQKGFTDLKSLNYRTTFDVYSTPKVFLLDKDKKILAKQLEAEQIETLIDAMVRDKARSKDK
jgi:thiol-disulfide isomerase/thioredoxin